MLCRAKLGLNVLTDVERRAAESFVHSSDDHRRVLKLSLQSSASLRSRRHAGPALGRAEGAYGAEFAVRSHTQTWGGLLWMDGVQ